MAVLGWVAAVTLRNPVPSAAATQRENDQASRRNSCSSNRPGAADHRPGRAKKTGSNQQDRHTAAKQRNQDQARSGQQNAQCEYQPRAFAVLSRGGQNSSSHRSAAQTNRQVPGETNSVAPSWTFRCRGRSSPAVSSLSRHEYRVRQGEAGRDKRALCQSAGHTRGRCRVLESRASFLGGTPDRTAL